MIQRTLQPIIADYIGKGKAILLVGARQVGKSTLFHQIADTLQTPPLWLNCDQTSIRDILTNPSLADLKMLIADNQTLVIDEAQRVENIGLTLKLITDNIPNIQLLVTGSSSLGLHDRINEPLTGRKIENFLYPISTEEIYRAEGLITVRE